MKAYKGFDKNLKCGDMQYKVGEDFESPEKPVRCGDHGLHACDYPLDVFGYYPPNESRYCEVEADGEVDRTNADDTNFAASRLHIGAELSLRGLIEAAIKFTFDRATHTEKSQVSDAGQAANHSGDQGAASATGDQGAASATGDQGAASATGGQGAASATGDQGAASATGLRGAASATGDQGAASATGYQGAASATGLRGAASATGDQGAASATGLRGAASATGKESIACGLGYQCKAKGALGRWIVLAERTGYPDYHILQVRAAQIDGVIIKADTYYSLINNEFIEVD